MLFDQLDDGNHVRDRHGGVIDMQVHRVGEHRAAPGYGRANSGPPHSRHAPVGGCTQHAHSSQRSTSSWPFAPPVQNARSWPPRWGSIRAGSDNSGSADTSNTVHFIDDPFAVHVHVFQTGLMDYFEKNAILSGIGISRIGRRTGIPGLELTLEAVGDAIADAGLTPGDIDGIGTLGDTPAAEVSAALQIDVADFGFGFDTGGLLTPVMSACLAVAERRARHVLVYRTVQMIGGAVPMQGRGERTPGRAGQPALSSRALAGASPRSVRWRTSTNSLPPRPTRR